MARTPRSCGVKSGGQTIPARPLDNYDASGFFAVRTPLLPFGAIIELGGDLQAASWLRAHESESNTDPELDALLKKDREVLRERLAELIRQPEIVDALFVASPSLESDLHRWNEKPDTKKGRRLENSVIKYFMRAASRCTPFGLFSGNSVGTIGERTRLEIAARAAYTRHTRLDMDYLTALMNHLAHSERVHREARLRVNSSAYRVGDRIRYAEARFTGRRHDYFLVDAEADDSLTATLERALGEGAFRKELAGALVDDEITLEDALAYIDELIDAQLLVPDIGPVITGPETIGDLVEQLRTLNATGKEADALDRVRRELARIDGDGLGVAPARYRDVAGALKDLDVDADIARLFQVDMSKPSTDMTLDDAIRDRIARGVETLAGLFGKKTYDTFKDFREQFRERYQDREVPLVEVLDEEIGIGFLKSNAPTAEASPLLEGLAFPAARRDEQITWRPWNAFLQRKLMETLKEGREELVLTDDEIENYLSDNANTLPDAFQVSCQLVPRTGFGVEGDDKTDKDATGEGRANKYRVILNLYHGPSGARLLGRFCHADPELCEHVKAHLRAEEALDPDTVYCEIVHHPPGRAGNILARPLLRDYELVYLGRSGAPPDRQIDVNDLMLSLRGDKIVLRSKRLGKEIVPRLTTAHNTSYGTPGIYKFLSALQPQGVNPGALWNWGSLANLPYLPRVRHGDVYFTLQTWNVRRSEIKRIIEGDPDANFRAIQQWRVERNMPRLVGLVEGDNVLAIDFDNPLSVDAFTALIKYRRSISLREIPGPDELVVQGPEGHFQHELVIPFVKRRKVDGPDDAVGAPVVASKLTSLPSVFPPGSQWLYVKIYAGPATIDRLLVDVVRPLTDRLFKAGDATRWFFLRYYDPNPHLRLRYFGDPEALTASVLPDIHRALVPYVEKGLVWKIQVDTYDREVNRYGGSAAMDLCEDIFHADSDAVTHILGRYLGDESSDARWRLTFKGMDMLLDDLGFDIEQKYDVLLKASESFSREFRIAGRFRKAVLDKYRSERASLAELIRNGAAEEQPLSPGVADLARRSPKVAAAASGLRELAGRDELTNSLQNITSSLLHMHANRLLRWSQRAQESLIYNFLVREYDSQLARMGIKKLDRPS